MGMIVTGYLDAPEERADEIATAFEDHARLSRQEPGCELFEVNQDSAIVGRFHINERYTDADALEAHKDRMASSDWARVSAGLTRNIDVREG
ncbi:antibiotic biosynthesis monooxygenase [Tropicimonas sp. TH_r6]|uniref:putative quinol monooxygenase n=1 Tax=Tropicimonas sp. TH_r6 TaxID=3082085 RepID=UPI00295561F5|nr:antibiotic biosynthesis monooxygenase [Tropicimonas sp. TH_r6]MDV7141663.1 antibiotic biosynthesis monooxygenase [Tropicimonas sp. TH_r6]